MLTKYYLLLDPTYSTKLADVWLLDEVPQKVRITLNLPERDQGIDIVARTKTGEFWAIQCKYRGSEHSSLTWREISTFTGLTFGVCKNFDFGLIAYTGERYTKVLSEAERISFLSSDTWSLLDVAFFARLSKELQGKHRELVPLKSRPHQRRALDKAQEYFKNPANTRGKLIMPCGTGKSLTGYWLADTLKAKTIVVAVPSLSLIQQTLPVWLREYAAEGKADAVRWLCVCSDQTVTKPDPDSVVIHTQDLGFPSLTNKEEIKAWLKETRSAVPRAIFTTYQSGKVLAEAIRESGTRVDLGIMDEAHKTVGQKEKLFSHLLFDENLPMERRVFMTATERRYAGQSEEIVSMDDPHVYGDTFELLSFKEALEAEPPILSDYKIITMVISHEEISKLIEENRYVRPAGVTWSDEIEAQMLASIIALRKAMQKYPIKHAVSFHSSIARARAFKEFNDHYTDFNPAVGELDTYHVTGATPSATRKQIINEFARASRSLITNARCLTEGVDVPNIDCVLFADPKQSTIDIVQAVGRALRTNNGKKFGYILVPIVSSGHESEDLLDIPAFKGILTVLRALAANDERIVEHFKAIHAGRRVKGGVVEIDIDEKIASAIDLESFAEKIETRVWDKLAKLSWQPYDEAVKFVHNLKLKRGKDWIRYCRGEMANLPAKPFDIPKDPSSVYESFKERGGWGAWVGVDNRRGGWRSLDEAIKFTSSLGLKSGAEWTKYCNNAYSDLPKRPKDIPVSPYAAYGNEFTEKGGMGAWLGTNSLAPQNLKYLPYDEAVKFVHKLGLKSMKEWLAYCKGKFEWLPKKPDSIPSTPYHVYKEVFVSKGGMGAWLGTMAIAPQNQKFVSCSKAHKFTLSLHLKSSQEWVAYYKGKRPDLPPKPSNIPKTPDHIYKKHFDQNGGWAWWLGTKNYKKINFRSYDEAKRFVNSLNLRGHKEWTHYCVGKFPSLPPRPHDIPSQPNKIYGDEFKKGGGWSGWVGRINPRQSWQPYSKAISFVHKLKLKSQKEWVDYCKGLYKKLPAKPVNIPATPDKVYKEEFKKRGGWGAWLGTNKRHNRAKSFLSYSDSVKFVNKLSLNSKKEWSEYVKGTLGLKPPLPENIPRSPDHVYKKHDEWKGWQDWLGTDKQ